MLSLRNEKKISLNSLLQCCTFFISSFDTPYWCKLNSVCDFCRMPLDHFFHKRLQLKHNLSDEINHFYYGTFC